MLCSWGSLLMDVREVSGGLPGPGQAMAWHRMREGRRTVPAPMHCAPTVPCRDGIRMQVEVGRLADRDQVRRSRPWRRRPPPPTASRRSPSTSCCTCATAPPPTRTAAPRHTSWRTTAERLVGYAHLDPASRPRARARRSSSTRTPAAAGSAAALVTALRSATGPAGCGCGPTATCAAARDLAAADGFTNVRELWQMRRPLCAGAPPLRRVACPTASRRGRSSPAGTSRPGSRSTPGPSPHHPEQGG